MHLRTYTLILSFFSCTQAQDRFLHGDAVPLVQAAGPPDPVAPGLIPPLLALPVLPEPRDPGGPRAPHRAHLPVQEARLQVTTIRTG